MKTLKYTSPLKVDSVHRGNLNQSRMLKKRIWREITFYRQRFKLEPLNGERSVIQLKLICLQDEYDKCKQWERETLRDIEVRANELGLTTVKIKD